MMQVMIPRYPGHLCALGQMLADLRRDSVLVWGGRLGDLCIDDLRTLAQRMQEASERALLEDGVGSKHQRHTFSLDMRYFGQSFTLPISWRPTDKDWSTVRASFDSRHQDTFGHATPDKEVEIVNIRLNSIGIIDKPTLRFSPMDLDKLQVETRLVWFGEWTDCPVLDRNAMNAGYEFGGPAIVEEFGGTSVIPPSWLVTVHESGALQCKQMKKSQPKAARERHQASSWAS
jgi:N-methylhydantoinase A